MQSCTLGKARTKYLCLNQGNAKFTKFVLLSYSVACHKTSKYITIVLSIHMSIMNHNLIKQKIKRNYIQS